MFELLKLQQFCTKLFYRYPVKFNYENDTNFATIDINIGVDRIYIYGCDDVIKATINERELKDIRKELKEFYNEKHN